MNVRQSKVVTKGERTSCCASREDLPCRRTRPARCRKDGGTAYHGGPGGIRAGRRFGPAGSRTREEREAGGATVRARDPSSRLRAALVAAAGCQGTSDLRP